MIGRACIGAGVIVGCVGLMAPYVIAAPARFAPKAHIPILYNDRHVDARPDELRDGRVLAALVEGDEILVPLSAMFAAMGAQTDYDGQNQAIVVSRADTVISLVVNRRSIAINGESRPLDVAPRLVNSRVLVPLRVIAEALGGYVQWLPDLRSVTVRYRATALMPATPPPPPAAGTPTAPPSAVPLSRITAPPIPPGPPPPRAARDAETFIVGDAVFGSSGVSYGGRGATEFSVLNLPWMLEIDGRKNAVSVKLGTQIAPNRIYAGIGYLRLSDIAGTPLSTGLGAGLEKLPDLDQATSFDASIWYYPHVAGACDPAVCSTGGTFGHSVLSVRIGGTVRLNKTGSVFLDGGYSAERRAAPSLAPVDTTVHGADLGLGIRL
jgi:hypothetical protein